MVTHSFLCYTSNANAYNYDDLTCAFFTVLCEVYRVIMCKIFEKITKIIRCACS